MRRIILVRHGQSQGNVDESKYITPGDPLLELTDEGWQQAHDAGKFLRWYYAQNPVKDDQSPTIWTSTYMRTRQTTQGVLKGLGWEDRPVHEDLRLMEQSYGAAAWAGASVHARDHYGLSRDVYKSNRFLTPLPHGESLMDHFMRIDSFLGTLHRREQNHGEDDVLIISHGATMKNFLMRWFHLPDYQWDQLVTPHNCDVIKLEHDGQKWDVRKIYDGESRHIALGKADGLSVGHPDMGNPLARLVPLPVKRPPEP